MTSRKLCEMTYPKYDKKIPHEYLAGHWIRLRWVDTPNTKIGKESPISKPL